jgi:hypothetical protein
MWNVAYERTLFPDPAVHITLETRELNGGMGVTHVYRESKATNPSSTSIQRTSFREQTIPRFPHDGPCVRCYGSSTDPEETATVGSFHVTGHLRCNLSHRLKHWHHSNWVIGRTSRFVYVACELLHEYWYCC